MIVVDQKDSFQLITQPEHAHLSARMLQLFRQPRVRERRNYDELLFATREHDNGWQELDSAPAWNAERSRPYDFLTLPIDERIELWHRGAGRFLDQHPYASALIMHHAWHLHTKPPLLETSRSTESDTPESDPVARQQLASISEMVSEMAALRDETLAGLDKQLDELVGDYFFLELADLLSLAICCQWQRRFTLNSDNLGGDNTTFDFQLVELATEQSAARIEIDPFPFAGTTTFRYRARNLGKRTFAGDTALAVAMLSAPSVEIEVKVSALSPP